MNRAAFTDTFIGEKQAGAVFSGFEGFFPFYKTFADFSVGNLEMSGDTVDVFSSNIERRSLEPIATVGRAEVTEHLVGGKAVGGRNWFTVFRIYGWHGPWENRLN